MKKLFEETQIGTMRLKNRFFRSATYDGMADRNGYMTEALVQRYEELAAGGVGTIITGLTAVLPEEPAISRQMRFYDDSYLEGYKTLTDRIHKYHANAVIQLASNGSQVPGSSKGTVWGPSAVEDLVYKVMPKEMSYDDIKQLVEAFYQGAVRAKTAGFDGIQIHGAHGYLFSKYLSPYYNHREDSYGGTTLNRARILVEVYEAIRDAVGSNYPVLVKINGEDYMDKGMTLEECLSVCSILDKKGISAIEISGGVPSSRNGEGTIRDLSDGRESYFFENAHWIAEKVHAPVIAVGGNRDFIKLEQKLKETEVEYVSLSRPFIREPDLIRRWEKGEISRAKCISCTKCFQADGTRCIFKS